MCLDAMVTVLRLADCPHNTSFRADDTAAWPDGALSFLTGQGILTEAGYLRELVCDDCEMACIEEVVFDDRESAAPARAFLVCRQRDDIGKIPIKPERLRSWIIDCDGIAAWVARELAVEGRVDEIATKRLWWLGRLPEHQPPCDIFLARGTCWDDWGAVLSAAGRLHESRTPVLLTFASVPSSDHLPGHVNCIPTTRLLKIEDGVVALDRSAVSGVASVGESRERVADNTFQRRGDNWLICYDGKQINMRVSKGLAYIAELIREPGKRIHVLRLVYGDKGVPPPSRPKHGKVVRPSHGEEGSDTVMPGQTRDPLSTKGNKQYLKSISELETKLEDAQRCGDVETYVDLQARINDLRSVHASQFGLYGSRDDLDPQQERARKAVSQAISRAFHNIDKHHSSLAWHLVRSIRLGCDCSYSPEHPISWTT